MSIGQSASTRASDGGSTSTSVVGDDFRAVQFTPPHSQCSIHFGKGLTTAEPGSAAGRILAVNDIDAARDDLDQPRRRGQRGVRLRAGPSRASIPRDRRRSYFALRIVQRPGRQRLAAPGDHDPAPRPGMGGLTWTSPRWPTCCTRRRTSRLVRGGRPAARLVGLVRGVPGRSPGREHPGRGRRGRRPLHGRGQARRRLDAPAVRHEHHATPALPTTAGAPTRGRGPGRT